jgi:hypothetical protein
MMPTTPNPYPFISNKHTANNTPATEDKSPSTTPLPTQLLTQLKDKYLEAEKNPHIPTRLWVSVAGAFAAGYFEPFADYHFIGAKIRKQTGLANPSWWRNPISYYLCVSKGITSFQASVVPATIIQVGIIDTAVNKLKVSYGENYPSSFDCAFSILGGVASAFVVTPLDHMILTAHHMSANGTKIGPWKAFVHLVQTHGSTRPWTALQTTMIREGGYSLGVWGLNKAIYKQLENSSVPDLKNISPVFAGTLSAVFTEPFDVTGRIMQKSTTPSGMLETMKMIYQEHGFSFFWRGLTHRSASIVGAIYLLNMITNESKKEIDRLFPVASAAVPLPNDPVLASHVLSVPQSLGIGAVIGLTNMGVSYLLQANSALTFNPATHKNAFQYLVLFPAGALKISASHLLCQQWVVQETDPTMQYAFGGFMGGMLSSMVTTPVDNVSIKMKQAAEYDGLNFRQTMRAVLHKQGMAGLYQGAASAALSSGVITVGFFSIMPKLREKIGGHDLVNVPLAGLAAGVATATLTHPLESVRAAQQSTEKPISIKASTQGLVKSGLFGLSAKGLLSHCARSTAKVTALGFINQVMQKQMTSAEASSHTPRY